MEEDLKARLLKPRIPEGEVQVEGVGTIRVRGLTRGEVLRCQGITKIPARERLMVSLGMVNPVMTEDDVAAWSRAAIGGELEKVSIAIAQLSGLNVEAPNAAYREFEDDSDAEFRVHPGAEAADDGNDFARDDA